MKGKLIWLNILLAGLICAASFKIHDEWVARQQRIEAVEHARVKAPKVATVTIPPVPTPVSPALYSDIAQKMLFSNERNPNVVVPVAPVEPPKPMPPLPILRGVMGLPGGLVAMMSPDVKAPAKDVQIGEKIGAFQMTALSDQQISLKWEDKTVTKSVQEMMQEAQAQAPAAAPPAQAAAAADRTSTASAAPAPTPTVGRPGIDAGRGDIKLCASGDATPEGTVVDGYKKILIRTPFGNKCEWAPVK